MATYAKGPKVIQDFGLGYQSVNRVQDSEQALHDAYAVEHTFEYPSAPPGQVNLAIKPYGGHNTVVIPRAIATGKTTTITLASGQTSSLFWFDLLSSAGQYIGAGALSRFSAGFYFVTTTNTDDASVWCEATPEGGASDVRFISTRFFSQLSGAPMTGVLLRCFELNSGTGKFAGADYNFSLALFSR